MSTSRSNVMDAMPRGSFLTYFRSGNSSTRRINSYRQRPPPPYSKHCSRAPPLPRIPEDADTDDDVDEESQLGFFDHYDPNEDDGEAYEEDERVRNGFDILGLLGYTLLVLLVGLNLDFLLSTFNVNTGLVNWGAYSKSPVTLGYEMKFCLAEQNREAPIPRVWRYISADSHEYCTSSTLTLYAAAAEEWKLLPEDAIVVRAVDEEGNRTVDKPPAEKDAGGDDDLAEEGGLGRRRYLI
ncbi:hypothetical protein BU23DRAFT_563841 [Bimuria novae-zelandiae CBS 107.79]|uniref:Uncharacterized protein n=1 Tax=Bimuria novae-zelandiae CBS 107.79 TaxID=1447943 RepID=A0A6A5VQX4_9PLEO|nr:hypothetical protein BU23DRAFT_563841 [Bimuria novae-zelandiae CBS 107.79]